MKKAAGVQFIIVYKSVNKLYWDVTERAKLWEEGRFGKIEEVENRKGRTCSHPGNLNFGNYYLIPGLFL